MWAVFDGQTIQGYDECIANTNSSAVCYGATGSQVLDNLGDNYSEVKPGHWILVLVGMSCALRFGQWLAVRSSV